MKYFKQILKSCSNLGLMVLPILALTVIGCGNNDQNESATKYHSTFEGHEPTDESHTTHGIYLEHSSITVSGIALRVDYTLDNKSTFKKKCSIHTEFLAKDNSVVILPTQSVVLLPEQEKHDGFPVDQSQIDSIKSHKFDLGENSKTPYAFRLNKMQINCGDNEWTDLIFRD